MRGLLRPSWSHALLFALLFVGAPAWSVRESDQPVVCKVEVCGPAPPVSASLLSALGPDRVPLRATWETPAWAAGCALVAFGFFAWWRATSASSRAALREGLRPTRRRVLLASPGWLTLPYTCLQFLVFTRRLDGMGQMRFHLMSATKAVALILFPVRFGQNLLEAGLVAAAALYAGIAAAPWLAPAEGGFHPAFYRPAGVAFVLAASAAAWYLAACGIDWLYRRLRRPGAGRVDSP